MGSHNTVSQTILGDTSQEIHMLLGLSALDQARMCLNPSSLDQCSPNIVFPQKPHTK